MDVNNFIAWHAVACKPAAVMNPVVTLAYCWAAYTPWFHEQLFTICCVGVTEIRNGDGVAEVVDRHIIYNLAYSLTLITSLFGPYIADDLN